MRRFVEACRHTRTILPATIGRLCADALVDAERRTHVVMRAGNWKTVRMGSSGRDGGKVEGNPREHWRCSHRDFGSVRVVADGTAGSH